jgi:hypothetical protein
VGEGINCHTGVVFFAGSCALESGNGIFGAVSGKRACFRRENTARRGAALRYIIFCFGDQLIIFGGKECIS